DQPLHGRRPGAVPPGDRHRRRRRPLRRRPARADRPVLAAPDDHRHPARPHRAQLRGRRRPAGRHRRQRADHRGPAGRGRHRAGLRRLPGAGVKGVVGFYRVVAATAVQAQFQYRTANYLYMIGMVAEPLVYLVVWQTVARAQGGAVQGITEGQFAAYYIVWTLVRNMNIVFTPYGWEERIQ